jgi:amino acid adenylation domain-containing protein
MIKRSHITVMDAVPSFWRTCTSMLESLDEKTRRSLLDNKLRLMLSASEPLRSDIPRTWTSEFGHPARHVHMFGQTETAGIVSLYQIPEDLAEDTNALPIGSPIANSELYILDENQQPCPADVAGELYIGGAGVGRGYLNRPELTATKFIPHPFDDREGARLYRTGDWARYDADGQIRFAGRQDQQVKLRGFRVELGEVETVLAKHPSIAECAVIKVDDERAGLRLVAYFVAHGPTLPTAALRNFLSGRLPEYAIPSLFVQMDALPLSAHGKVDRLALPEVAYARPNLSSDYFAPRTPDEDRMAAIWSEVLGLERIGINDNLFELGGHSLVAAQIVARVRAEFRTEISLRVLFESPTIAQVVKRLESQSKEDSYFGTITRHERNEPAPLSFTQQQFWLLDQTEPESSYNICSAIEIAGPLDLPQLQTALEMIVERHEILRTYVGTNQGDPVQVVAASMPVPFDVLDLSHVPTTEREGEIRKHAAAEAEKRFDLNRGPLMRIKILSLGPDRNVFLITIHHLICDGWSVEVLLRDLATLYGDLGADRVPSLPDLKIQYADYAVWQRGRATGERFARQLEYWKKELAGTPPTLELPTDFPRPQRLLLKGSQETIQLSEQISDALRTLSREEGATLFMTLLAAFQTLLFRYSGQEDILVGAPIAGRSMLEMEDLIGSFVNTLVLRADLAGKPTFREFLGRVRETTLEALSNQEVPFEMLVGELNPERSTNRSPLFQTMFTLENSSTAATEVQGLTLTPLKLPATSAKFDLTLVAEEEPAGIRLSFEYSTELFAPETIKRMLGHLENLLEAIVIDPAQTVTELPLLTGSEQYQLLHEWNSHRMSFPQNSCIHTLFEHQVEIVPDAIAVEFLGEQLTYREVNRRANQLAHYLRKRGVGPDALVGICINRSLEMLVGMLSVLKAGGAYVPLDPAYPTERLAFMIDDAELSLVLTQDSLTAQVPAGSASLFCLDKDWGSIAQESEDNPAPNVSSTNLAYVIYTSGSTGNPKGVMIEHRSVVNFSITAAAAYEIKPTDRILQFASLCFDLSVEEIYPALTHGATVVLRSDEMISSAREFLRYCDEWRTTILDLPTAYWNELTDALKAGDLKLPERVRLVIIGGEKAAFDRVAAWHKAVRGGVRLANTYGPTEATVAATICDLKPSDECARRNIVPIGRPLANATVYLLDQALRPVPIGSPSELFIGGPGVARGYVNRPELTAEKFVNDPFSDDRHARLYKTGDLVRYRPDGNIEFLGRVDNQIKIRGFRVELEEIELALRSQPGVGDCVVVLHEDSDGDKRLIAYLVEEASSQLKTTELRNSLKTKLPAYMVPAFFEIIEALPLLPNGKINRRALPEPRSTIAEMDATFVAPRTPIESLLAVEWCDVLKLQRIGIHDNFFELGGQSLLASRVVSRVRGILPVELNTVDLFQAPTIASLAKLLLPRGAQNESEEDLAALLGELASLTDEEAQLCFNREMLSDQAAAA